MNKQKGFALVEALTIVLILIALGAGAWYIYGHQKKNTAKTASTSEQTKAPVAKDPYAGWKTYCDEKTNGCFKYPADWTLNTAASGYVSNDLLTVTVTSPSRSVHAGYTSPWDVSGDPAGPSPFYAASAEPLSSPIANLKVVGVMTTVNNMPLYELVDVSLLTTYPLTVGQTSQLSLDEGFTNKNSSVHSNFAAFDDAIGSTHEPDKAKAWFDSDDGNAARLIIRSFYYR